MAQTKAGAEKLQASKAGVTVEEFRRRIADGEKWCWACRTWHPIAAFAIDNTRHDRLSPRCKRAANARRKQLYQPSTKPRVPRRFAVPRDGDKLQARGRVNMLVRHGKLPKPADASCLQCGHQGEDKRHEYHHHLGYAPEHHDDVVVLCSTCHAAADTRSETAKRRPRNKNGQFLPGEQ